MSGARRLAAICLVLGGLVWAAPTASAHAAAYRSYVACGLSQNAKPSHVCQKARQKGAFFRSNEADVFYTVCVQFPTDSRRCRKRQKAEEGTLYVNKIDSNIPGRHKVTWWVKGKRVGAFRFRIPD